MKRCRLCGEEAIWILWGDGEKARGYCSLTHLAEEVNEALTTPYTTPAKHGNNARFFGKGEFKPNKGVK